MRGEQQVGARESAERAKGTCSDARCRLTAEASCATQPATVTAHRRVSCDARCKGPPPPAPARTLGVCDAEVDVVLVHVVSEEDEVARRGAHLRLETRRTRAEWNRVGLSGGVDRLRRRGFDGTRREGFGRFVRGLRPSACGSLRVRACLRVGGDRVRELPIHGEGPERLQSPLAEHFHDERQVALVQRQEAVRVEFQRGVARALAALPLALQPAQHGHGEGARALQVADLREAGLSGGFLLFEAVRTAPVVGVAERLRVEVGDDWWVGGWVGC